MALNNSKKNNFNSVDVKSIFLRTLVGFYARKTVYELDNIITNAQTDLENTSVRCINCNLLNSFSFNTSQTTCIRCNFNLLQEEIHSTEIYKKSLEQCRNKRMQNNEGDSNVR